jgi:hypothetical protein
MSISNTGMGGAVATVGSKLGDWLTGPNNTWATLKAIELEHHLGSLRDQQKHANNLELEKLKIAGRIVETTHKAAAGSKGKIAEARANQRIHMRNAQFALDNLDKGVAYNNRNLSVNPVTSSFSKPTLPISPEQKAIHDHVSKIYNSGIKKQSTIDANYAKVLALHGGNKRKVNDLIRLRVASHYPGISVPVRK